MTVEDVILNFNPDLDASKIRDRDYLAGVCETLGIPVEDAYGAGKLQIEIFEKTGEDRLREPTFVTHYPTEVSPLSRQNDDDPFVTDRFELFISGREIANGFSELNDPEEQAERFRAQAADGGYRSRHRPPRDAVHRLAVDPRRPPVPAHASRGVRLGPPHGLKAPGVHSDPTLDPMETIAMKAIWNGKTIAECDDTIDCTLDACGVGGVLAGRRGNAVTQAPGSQGSGSRVSRTSSTLS